MEVEEEEENREESEKRWFGYVGECGFVMCENEEEWKGIYRERGGYRFG